MKRFAVYIFLIVLLTASCNNKNTKLESNEKSTSRSGQQALTKPQSSFRDTMQINFSAAVFYHPDSLQLDKIRMITDSAIFEASMHEYFYQMRNARMSINRDFPRLTIVEAKNIRYLSFSGNGIDTVIDLNTRNDPYGLFLFQPGAGPHVTDMMNIDTELGFYFKNK